MAESVETCWTMVRDAARGEDAARDRFADSYMEVVRAYLLSRWRGRRELAAVDDAVQDVFYECFRAGGALARVEDDSRGAFRTFLYAVVRNVARRHEERRASHAARASDESVSGVATDDESLAGAFDRAWARALVQRARRRHRAWAATRGEREVRRFDLLEERFGRGRPVRDVAAEWDVPAAELHVDLRRAREDFKQALREEVAFQHPGTTENVEAECLRVLALLNGNEG